MKFDKTKVMGILAKNLNLSGLMADVLDEVLEPILQEFVADSANPYDDMLMAAIYPVLERELKAKLVELLDGLFKEDEEEVVTA